MPALHTRSIFAILFCVATGVSFSQEVKSVKWPGEIILPGFPKPDPVQVFSELGVFDINGSPISRAG